MFGSKEGTMEHKFIVSDPEKCTGCRLCELVCSGVKERGFNPLLSRIRIVRADALQNVLVVCRLCKEPTCVKSCPRKALRKNKTSGTISVDYDRCSGCRLCINACEFGAIAPHPKKAVVICDLCEATPKCVDFCPKGALSLKTAVDADQNMRRKAFRSSSSTNLLRQRAILPKKL